MSTGKEGTEAARRKAASNESEAGRELAPDGTSRFKEESTAGKDGGAITEPPASRGHEWKATF